MTYTIGNKHVRPRRVWVPGVGGGVLLVLVILLFAAWPFAKAPADKIALSYGGGPFEGAKFQKVVQPGSGLKFNGWFDKWYEYPVTQRNYIISKVEGEGERHEADFITAPSSDRVPVEWELSAYFKLNTRIIRKFHETVGLKYKAWTDAGWDTMLHQTFRQQLEAAVQAESRKHTSDEYQSSADVIDKVRLGIASSLKTNVNTVLGDEFFCGPTYDAANGNCPEFEVVVKKPSLPKDIVDSYQRQKTSANDIITATNNAKVAEETARGQKLAQSALAGIYNDPNYVEYLRALAMQDCARNGNCTLVVTPGGTGTNINVGK